ncbi:CHAT domain-containing protein [Candidatus Thiosymbion oneisti]|uniref:CHAT domain-containing protein n=1 Tax=Candidatus Thiosymbion oneisti TaxID=589554 RepID=UPI0010604E9B|nr:CHAT domain-containing protein [Candidatus Thiosymbion oneisti]
MNVFISYSRQDRALKEDIKNAIKELPEYLRPDVWSDVDLRGGDCWDKEIQKRLGDAELVVLLLSDEFLTTDYVRDDEFPIIEAGVRDNSKRIYPILMRALREPLPNWIPTRQVRPKLDQSLHSLSQQQYQQERERIQEEIKEIIRETMIPTEEELFTGSEETVESIKNHVDFDITLYHRDRGFYRAELQITYRSNPTRNYALAYEFRIPAHFDTPKCASPTDTDQSALSLGERLGEAIFPENLETDCDDRRIERSPRRELKDALDCVTEKRALLHLRITVAPNAQELHRIRWERLVNPLTGEYFSVTPFVAFSRHVLGYEQSWREVQLRHKPGPQEPLRTLILLPEYSDPDQKRRAEEVCRNAASCIQPAALTDAMPRHKEDGLEPLIDRLKQDTVDVLYIACRCYFGSEESSPHADSPVHPRAASCRLRLGGLDDLTAEIPVETLARRLAEVRTLPRLVILCSAQSATDARSDTERAAVVAAAILTQAGIPAVLAAQLPMVEDACRLFLTDLFQGLRQFWSIDTAVAVARSKLRDQELGQGIRGREASWWRPALVTRSKSGQIWYRARLSGDAREVAVAWDELKRNAHEGKLLPVIGPGLTEDIAGSHREIAQGWAFSKGFALGYHERADLLRVAQFLKLNLGDNALLRAFKATFKERLKRRNADLLPDNADQLSLSKLFTAIASKLREEQDARHEAWCKANPGKPRAEGCPRENPYSILARLQCPVYVVGALNRVLVDTLESVGRSPRILTMQQIIRPEESGRPDSEVRAEDPPTPKEPLVYHLFGHLDDLDGTILTQDEYFNFLIDFARFRTSPSLKTLSSRFFRNDVAFLGFKHYDWSFLTLLHSLQKLPGENLRRSYTQVAVQIDPDDDFIIDPNGTTAFLQRFLDEKDVMIYWGKPEDFLNELDIP